MARRVSVSDLFSSKPDGGDQNDGADQSEDRLIYVDVSRLLANPHNPREDIGDLSDLKSIATIQRQSVLTVTRAAYLALFPDEDEACRGIDYVVINGCRRWAAARKWGRPQLACTVNDGVAASRATLARAAYDENVERRDFDPIEEARAVMQVVAEYPTAKQAAEAEGWSEPWISTRKNLLKIHPELQQQVRLRAQGSEDGLSIRLARQLGAVKGVEAMALAEQQSALEAIVRAEAEATAAKKEARRQARENRPAQESPTEQQAAALEFPAVNSGAAAPLPEQRTTPGQSADSQPEAPAAPSNGAAPTGAPVAEPASPISTQESDGEQGASAALADWLLPDEDVQLLSLMIAEQAQIRGVTPGEELQRLWTVLGTHYSDATAGAQ